MKDTLPKFYYVGAILLSVQAALAIAITAVQSWAWVWQLRASHGFIAIASLPIVALFSYTAFAVWKRRSSALSLAVASACVTMSLAILSIATEHVLQKRQRDADQWLYYMLGVVILLLICAAPALCVRLGLPSARKTPIQMPEPTSGQAPGHGSS
jgi:predicted neutral ceramidase superfamily lipid hydrolase